MPALRGRVRGPTRRESQLVWHGLAIELSDWVRARHVASIAALATLAMAGFILPFLWRPARLLVWLVALVVVVGVGRSASGPARVRRLAPFALAIQWLLPEPWDQGRYFTTTINVPV